ncbi:hypothetical protein IF1G_11139 [Cordyceps javanica]|uniref:Uncharacterized protein n=1 Tax=Cordyceps javanica TaxID=43265 RepID=A0A545UL43_9HYPO|nr:hypothetical protein IF1G_11139 [Cordyceps javanica]
MFVVCFELSGPVICEYSPATFEYRYSPAIVSDDSTKILHENEKNGKWLEMVEKRVSFTFCISAGDEFMVTGLADAGDLVDAMLSGPGIFNRNQVGPAPKEAISALKEYKLLMDQNFEKLKRIEHDILALVSGESAQTCLAKHLENNDFHIQLMLMQVLTLASSTQTPEVPSKPVQAQAFAAAKKNRDAGRYAVSLITRMLWFLDPDAFPWEKVDGSPHRRTEAPTTGFYDGLDG